MAHKTLIGGTAYEISGGKTLIDGTAYKIEKGKTRVDGTAYDVPFTAIIEVVNGETASVNMIAGAKYGLSLQGMQEFPIGTILKICIGLSYANRNGSYGISKVIVNGEVVCTHESHSSFGTNTKNYEYTVTRDATIVCERFDPDGNGTNDYGIVTITEH